MSEPFRTSPASVSAPDPASAEPGHPTAAAPAVPDADAGHAEHERQFHRYASNHIPWWVRAMWVCYWIGAVYYATIYLIPMVRASF